MLRSLETEGLNKMSIYEGMLRGNLGSGPTSNLASNASGSSTGAIQAPKAREPLGEPREATAIKCLVWHPFYVGAFRSAMGW
jgi:hypothetical protein